MLSRLSRFLTVSYLGSGAVDAIIADRHRHLPGACNLVGFTLQQEPYRSGSASSKSGWLRRLGLRLQPP
jgi:hypothetical protein